LRRLLVWCLVLALPLAFLGCVPKTVKPPTPQYGVSWSLATSGGPQASATSVQGDILQEGTIPTGVNDSAVASGWWITDPELPYGQIPRFYAWQDVNGVRTPAKADWSVTDSGVGTLPWTQDATEAFLVPTRAGTTSVVADIQGTVCSVEVVVYPAMILQSSPGIEINNAAYGAGYVFSSETYTNDPSAADIYIQSDGTLLTPGGRVVVGHFEPPDQRVYLHEVVIPDMSGAVASGGAEGGTTLVLTTQSDKHVAVSVGSVTYRSGGAPTGYAITAGYRLLD
jgi:hypothetical protein